VISVLLALRRFAFLYLAILLLVLNLITHFAAFVINFTACALGLGAAWCWERAEK
jgi:hypothetical protein